MAKFKVRWALISYGNGTEQVLAFRGMTIEDVPANEVPALLDAGAIVEEDAELDMPGTLLPIPVAPSDEELVAWVGSASQTEVLQAVNDRPELSARIKDAWAAHQERIQAQLEVLGQRIDEIPDAPAEEPSEDELTTLETWINDQEDPAATRAQLDELAAAVPATDAAPVLDDEYFDQVVAQNVSDVTKFVSEYPQYASQVLDAENRRSDDPRSTVVRAVEAAAAFSGQ